MLQSLYHWTMGLAAHRHAVWWLAAIAFIESSVFPVPPDVLLIAMVLAARHRAWEYAAICTIASVLGGLLGYAIGYGLFETVGMWVLNLYNLGTKFAAFQHQFNEHGIAIVAISGLTPFPYKVVTIASGVTQLDLLTFTATSVVARGLRFFLVCALLWQFGPPIRAFIEQRLGLMLTLFVVLLVGGFAALKLL
ncbi:YqaA family protein [Telmatospirillum sp. J64-1]|uniref:YqaA family protein n=1 Tax=Telmatospirillum sp. J64-1 TaxID=2502183 RepID=UPI00115F663C|nr:YqaA family protein [Telmatospirillum sp. J64-1]